MAYLRKRRFPSRTYGKLKDKQNDLCKVIAKYDPNANKIELLKELNINPVFNVVDLKKCHALNVFKLVDPA